jgi:hypothetical protein
MFASEAGAYLSETPLRYSNLGQAPGLTYKYYTRQEKDVRNKHSNLLVIFGGCEKNNVL